MSPEQLYGLAAVVAATATLVVAIAGLRTTKAGLKATEGVRKATEEVHELVNQRSTDDKVYQAALVKALTAAGVEVPLDKSLMATQE